MLFEPKKYRFYNIITQSMHGMMIVNKLDKVISEHISKYGAWAETEPKLFIQCLNLAKKYRPDIELCYLEIGANNGSHLIPVVKAFNDQIQAHAYEAQRLVFYTLAGNVALQSFENCHVHHIAMGATNGTIDISIPRYDQIANFGSYEITQGHSQSDFKGEVTQHTETVAIATIDSLKISPTFIKIDVEGMEPQVLKGGLDTLATHKPMIYLEYHKCGIGPILELLKPLGYTIYDYPVGGDKNLLAMPAWMASVKVDRPIL